MVCAAKANQKAAVPGEHANQGGQLASVIQVNRGRAAAAAAAGRRRNQSR